jgi:hypothetical protein
MSSDDEIPKLPPPEPDGTQDSGLQDVLSGFDLVPDWARRPSDEASPDIRAFDRESDRRGARGRRDERDGRGRGGGGGAGGRPPGRPGAGTRDGGRRKSTDRRGPPAERERRELPAWLPIEVGFVPERAKLGAVVRLLHATKKAYPLVQIARHFLGKRENFLVKLEAREGAGGEQSPMLFHCAVDHAITLDRESMEAHAAGKHLEEFFEAVDTDVEPPAGNFVCVGRCRLSGSLLGPPNHHAYAEKLQELHRSLYSHLPIEEYRRQIDVVRDPALVEQWREQYRKQRQFRARGNSGEAPLLKRADAEATLLAEHGARLIQSGQRFVIPGMAIDAVGSEVLRRQIFEALSRENRSPFKMIIALRPAFRHMRLNLFKAKGQTFVSAVEPRPIDEAHAIDSLKKIFALLHEQPGVTRKQLAEKLCPGSPDGSPERQEAMSPIGWLVEKGHVIEFADGSLAIPVHAGGSGATGRAHVMIVMEPQAAEKDVERAEPGAAG